MESVMLLIILVLLIMLGAPVGFTLIMIPVVYILITPRGTKPTFFKAIAFYNIHFR